MPRLLLFPQRLKPASGRRIDRSAKALRHPKAFTLSKQHSRYTKAFTSPVGVFGGFCGTLYLMAMRPMLRFLWNATRGHRIAPWRSPYLLWRMETYTGVKMTQIGFLEFWEFMWIERASLWRFLKWTAEMNRYVHPKAKNS